MTRPSTKITGRSVHPSPAVFMPCVILASRDHPLSHRSIDLSGVGNFSHSAVVLPLIDD